MLAVPSPMANTLALAPSVLVERFVIIIENSPAWSVSGSTYCTKEFWSGKLTPLGVMFAAPINVPTVLPMVNGSRSSAPRMYAPTGDLKVASADHEPTAPWYIARTRQVKLVSGSRVTEGVNVTLDPLPKPPTTP